MTALNIALDDIERLIGGRYGTFDVACPACGPSRQSTVNRRRKVLRVWKNSPTFATYHCARCEVHGYAREDGAPAADPVELAKAKAEAQRFAATTAEARRSKARWLWGQRQPIDGTSVERYLREVRRYGGPIPSTIGFLPARGDHSPAMISAFGMPVEIEPGVLAMSPDAIQAVHLTRLAPDGSGEAGTDTDKIMLGTPCGAPIALAAIGDMLGLAITEGIEDALSMHEATGLGAWAAGSASFMSALAEVVPSYVETVTVMVDDDDGGRQHAAELVRLLRLRLIEVRSINLAVELRAA